jgi:uncharacterized protein
MVAIQKKISQTILNGVTLFRLLTNPLGRLRCRFYPSCGDYCQDALKKHGLFKGLWLTLGRLLRCQFFTTAGVDFIPDSTKESQSARIQIS